MAIPLKKHQDSNKTNVCH